MTFGGVALQSPKRTASFQRLSCAVFSRWRCRVTRLSCKLVIITLFGLRMLFILDLINKLTFRESFVQSIERPTVRSQQIQIQPKAACNGRLVPGGSTAFGSARTEPRELFFLRTAHFLCECMQLSRNHSQRCQQSGVLGMGG